MLLSGDIVGSVRSYRRRFAMARTMIPRYAPCDGTGDPVLRGGEHYHNAENYWKIP